MGDRFCSAPWLSTAGLYLKTGNRTGVMCSCLLPVGPYHGTCFFNSESFPQLCISTEAELREPIPLSSAPYGAGASLTLGCTSPLQRTLWVVMDGGFLLSWPYIRVLRDTTKNHIESPSPFCISYGRWNLVSDSLIL